MTLATDRMGIIVPNPLPSLVSDWHNCIRYRSACYNMASSSNFVDEWIAATNRSGSPHYGRFRVAETAAPLAIQLPASCMLVYAAACAPFDM
jgi:hypothetical protein